ncbi:MAG: helix-turn-helix domain-containing protein [Hydrogenophaga sp.]
MDRRHISEIELGRNTPGLRLIFKLCDALDVGPSDLIKDIERRMRVQGPR